MKPHLTWATRGVELALIGALASCSPQPTSVPVTLTAPPPTPTPQPLALIPAMQAGAAFAYADGTALVAVPHGEFLMGHGTADDPEHRVFLSDFWLYSTEVTNYQFELCVAQGWCEPPDDKDNPEYGAFGAQQRPVVGITYDQAESYCKYMGGELPTEAQWEKAARGLDGRPYPWGGAAPSCDVANSGNCVRGTEDVTLRPKGKSPYGALNMAGNVYEWVADWYDALYYESSPSGDPPGPEEGRFRVVRSSGYRGTPEQLLAYARSYASPRDHRPDLGFRCVVSNPAVFAPACGLTPTMASDLMANARVDCPTISIDVQVTACRYGGGAVVTFSDDHERDPNASFGGIVGCTLTSGSPGAYPISYECRRASTAVMSTRCTYSGLPVGGCPTGYEIDPDSGLCKWGGARSPGIECPGGEFYDPVSHCCRIASGQSKDFPVCPVGLIFTETDANRFACLPSEAVRTPPQTTEAINPPVCGNLCELTVELCSVRNLVFCPTTCSCLAVGRKCPDP